MKGFLVHILHEAILPPDLVEGIPVGLPSDDKNQISKLQDDERGWDLYEYCTGVRRAASHSIAAQRRSASPLPAII